MIQTIALLLLLPAHGDVREVRDIPYYAGAGFDTRKHRLNLFLPESKQPFPVVMFIHGGGWWTGDRWQYSLLGRRFAEQGIGFAIISYRLSPKVQHPIHAKDCARAFAWLYRNVQKYGGNRDRLLLAGHSAGGHLAALLTLDRRYLDAVDVPRSAVKGAIPLSAPLRIPGPKDRTWLNQRMFSRAFGTDPKISRSASPLTYVNEIHVPMLVVTETIDSLGVREMMKPFQKAVHERKMTNVEFVDAEGRAHISIMIGMMQRGDPVLLRVIRFIRKNAEK